VQPTPHVQAIPFALRWLVQPQTARFDAGGLSITAGPGTDWFVDPRTDEAIANAPALVGPVEGDFVLSARLDVEFAGTYDAGALMLWRDDRTWAKLCFEYSYDHEPMVVSVVTRGASDDCNSAVVDGPVWLRVARIGRAYAFHASTDGGRWDFVRHFGLGVEDALEVGFVAQSPRGDGCTATFSDIRFAAATLGDLRSGE
jgi:uncharacterized protein